MPSVRRVLHNCFDCGTFEEFKFCHRCGKKELVTLVRDENGNAVFDADNKSQYTEESHFGYGCLCLAGKNGGATLYSVTEPLTDEAATDIHKSFNTTRRCGQSLSYEVG